jgi:hypothetical protein
MTEKSNSKTSYNFNVKFMSAQLYMLHYLRGIISVPFLLKRYSRSIISAALFLLRYFCCVIYAALFLQRVIDAESYDLRYLIIDNDIIMI